MGAFSHANKYIKYWQNKLSLSNEKTILIGFSQGSMLSLEIGTNKLLGGLLLANTTNEANYLTNTERTSLLEKGFTNEHLDTMLYCTMEETLAASSLLSSNALLEIALFPPSP